MNWTLLPHNYHALIADTAHTAALRIKEPVQKAFALYRILSLALPLLASSTSSSLKQIVPSPSKLRLLTLA